MQVYVCGTVFVWRHSYIMSFLSSTIFFSNVEGKNSQVLRKKFLNYLKKKDKSFRQGICTTQKNGKREFVQLYRIDLLISGLYCILFHRIPFFFNRGSVTSIGPRMGSRRMVLYRSSMSTHSLGLTTQLGYSH